MWKEKKAVKGGAVNYSALLQAGLNVMVFFFFFRYIRCLAF